MNINPLVIRKAAFAGALMVATAVAVATWTPQRTPAVKPVKPVAPLTTSVDQPVIEVVFAIDTTGSMSGLIEGAKQKIWSIASSMGQAQPTPTIRMGLVAYRDRGDAYVTRVYDLTEDLDAMYLQLMEFQAEGGGDTPEAVNKALEDAVNAISWSKDSSVYKTVFLVGDAPAHDQRAGERPFASTVSQAVHQGIIVNTILCGENQQAAVQWRQIAQLAQGRFFDVDQGGGALAVITPFDEQIAVLSAELDDTRVFFGNAEALRAAEKKQAASDRLRSEASASSRVRRALFNVSESGRSNFVGDSQTELVEAYANGDVDVAAIETEMLPEPMQSLAPAERVEHVENLAKKRADIQQRIQSLAEARDGYIRDQLEDRESEEEASLDYQIFETVRNQAAAKGLTYEKSQPDY